jgi:hypothetical protein
VCRLTVSAGGVLLPFVPSHLVVANVPKAVEDCVDDLASDARLSLSKTVEEIRAALVMQPTQAAGAVQWPLDAALAAAATAAASAGSDGGAAAGEGTPSAQRGAAVGSRAVLPPPLTAKEQKRSRSAT